MVSDPREGGTPCFALGGYLPLNRVGIQFHYFA